jgi:hypothetical protein
MFETAVLSSDENHKTIPLKIKAASGNGNFIKPGRFSSNSF